MNENFSTMLFDEKYFNSHILKHFFFSNNICTRNPLPLAATARPPFRNWMFFRLVATFLHVCTSGVEQLF